MPSPTWQDILQKSFSLSRMAKDLGYSQFALSRVFSSVFHTNFNQYLNDLRLNCALGLLKNTSLPVTELAMNAGFTSLRTFNRAFKERFHMSPREYRKQQAAPRFLIFFFFRRQLLHASIFRF